MILILYYVICTVAILAAVYLWVKMLRLNKTYKEIIYKERQRLTLLKNWNKRHKVPH